MPKIIKLPEDVMYELQRVQFEYSRSIDNVAFMLDKHIGDSDTSYLENGLFDKLIDRAAEACAYLKISLSSVVDNYCPSGSIKWRFLDNYAELEWTA